VGEFDETNRHVTVQQFAGRQQGQGPFNLDFIIYHWLSVDLQSASKATLEALRLPGRLLFPFVVLIALSWITPRNRPETLDRYYVKMKTVVERDPEADLAALAESYANPRRFDHLKLFPGSQLEFCRPRASDVIGVVVSCALCFAIVGLLVWLSGIGRPS
jgi:SSS family solute:Na+ symporter